MSASSKFSKIYQRRESFGVLSSNRDTIRKGKRKREEDEGSFSVKTDVVMESNNEREEEKISM